jgi:uncharacterized protein (TIRG00374 family)
MPEPGVARRAPNRKRTIITAIFGLIVMVAVFAFLFPQFANYQQAFAQLERLNGWWVAGLVAASALNIWIYPWTAKAALPELNYGPAFVNRQVGFLISNVVPGGGAVAVGTQYTILSRYRIAPGPAAAAVTADAVWTYLMTLGTPALAVVLLVIEGRSTAGFLTIAILGLVAVAISVTVIAITMRSAEGAQRVGNVLQRIVSWLFRLVKKPAPNIDAMVLNFYQHASTMVRERWKQLTLTNIAAQLGPFVVLLVAVMALGGLTGELTIIEVFAAYSIAILLVSFPITPGGLGTVDAALVALLVAFGLDSATAVAVDLIWRLVWFLPQLAVGLGCLGWFSVKHRRTSPAPG